MAAPPHAVVRTFPGSDERSPAQSGAASTGSSGPRPLPIASTYGRIHWVTYQNYGAQPTTPAAFSLIAQMDDMVVAGPSAMSQIGPS